MIHYANFLSHDHHALIIVFILFYIVHAAICSVHESRSAWKKLRESTVKHDIYFAVANLCFIVTSIGPIGYMILRLIEEIAENSA